MLSNIINFLYKSESPSYHSTPGSSKKPKLPIFYGWYIIIAGFAGYFAIGITTTETLSIFISPIADEFKWSRSLISGSVALGTVLCAPFCLIAGPFIDKYGARWIVAISAFIVGIGFLGMAIATNPIWFYIAVALTRIGGVGLIGLAINTTIINWFIIKRGRAVAIATMGASFSIISIPLIAQVILEIYSWRIALIMLSLIVWIITIIPSIFLLKRRPEDIGLVPDGVQLSTKILDSAVKSPKIQYGPEQTDYDWTLSEAIHTRALWLLVISVPLSIMVLGGTTLHQTAHLVEQNLTPVAAASTFSFFAIGLGLSRLIWGFLSERYPLRYCMATGAVFMGIGELLLLNSSALPTAISASLILGVGVSGAITLEPVIYANYFGRLHLGSIKGFASIFRWATAAAGPILSGVTYDLTGNYNTILLIYVMVMILVCILMIATLPPKLRLGSTQIIKS